MSSKSVFQSPSPYSTILEVPPRPKVRAIPSAEVQLQANYFKLEVELKKCWKYQIEVAGKPENKSDKAASPTGYNLKCLVRKALKILAEPNKIPYASDFKSSVVTTTGFPNLSCEVLSDDDQPKPYRVTLSSPQEIDISHVLLPSAGAQEKCRKGQITKEQRDKLAYIELSSALEALGIILSHDDAENTESRITTVGRSRFFDTGTKEDPEYLNSPHGALRLVKGFRQSVRPADKGFLLNVNMTKSVFLGPMRLDEFMSDSSKVGLGKPIPSHDVSALNEQLQGLRVMYTAGKKKLKLVRGLARKNPPQESPPLWYYPDAKTFSLTRDSKMNERLKAEFNKKPNRVELEISVQKYFHLQHDIQLDPQFPLIDLGNNCYVGAECCEIPRWQLFTGDLSRSQAQIVQKTALSPEVNKKWVMEAPSKLKSLSKRPLGKSDDFGVTVDSKLLNVRGRQLKIPKINYGESELNPSSGGWNLKPHKMFRAGHLLPGNIHCFHFNIDKFALPENKKKQIGAALDSLRGEWSKDMGKFGNTQHTPCFLHHTLLEGILKSFLNKYNKDIHFALIILPGNKMHAKAIYNRIKKVGDVDLGLRTIAITESNLVKGGSDIYANIALKFNLKTGGVNHTVSSQADKTWSKTGLPLIEDGETMVVGYDVSHPTGVEAPQSNTSETHQDKGKKESLPPSFVGLVASVDKVLSNWPADAWTNETRVEIVNGRVLAEKLKLRLNLWKKNNKTLPKKIIVYRDGVSEGQYQQVLAEEVAAIRELLRGKPGGQDEIKLLFIITVKRHQTRFYHSLGDKKWGNPNPGLVVDQDVTVSRYWDFYLQPHKAIQGTARPVHYTVLYDNFFQDTYKTAAADVLQQLTHDMCYAYGRATRAVSVCPPVYYADLVCTRAKLHWNERKNQPWKPKGPSIKYDPLKVHEKVSETMYYI